MKKQIRDRQNELLYKSIKLRELAMDDKGNSDEIRKIQDDTYKKWIFYKNLSKELNKKVNDENKENICTL